MPRTPAELATAARDAVRASAEIGAEAGVWSLTDARELADTLARGVA